MKSCPGPGLGPIQVESTASAVGFPASVPFTLPFISAAIYFVVFMLVLYFFIVVPYKMVQARRGQVVFGDPAPVKTCPACLSTDLPAAASKCKYCGTDQPMVA